MATVFQVTGLARSGTGFISTFLNLHREAVVFHDIISDVEDWRGALSQAKTENEFVGDCGTYQYLPVAVIEDSRKVFIDRNPESSRQAAERAFGYRIPKENYAKAVDASKAWVAKYQPLVVPFNDLWTVDGLRKIWDHCYHWSAFPREKAVQFLKMNIQRANAAEVFGTSSLSTRVTQLF